MSASTDDRIKAPDDEGEQPRRIIDVEKEALVLMAEALDALGDALRGVRLFRLRARPGGRLRGQGVRRALRPPRPGPYRRHGAAPQHPHGAGRIRHAAAQLGRQEARLKALILLSDGYPQDFDYGQDRKSRDYGLQGHHQGAAGSAAQGPFTPSASPSTRAATII